jgi:membrane protease YdiL (CAAX protease family)
MIVILNDLIRFIKDPYHSGYAYNHFTVKQKLAFSAKLYFLNFGLFIFIFIERFILHACGIEIIDSPENIRKEGIYFVWIVFVFYAPLLEEFVFRLPLSLRKRDISIALFVFLGAVIINVCKRINGEVTKTIISFGLLFLSTVAFYWWDKAKNRSLENIKNKYSKSIVLVSMMLFACIHISNIDNFDIHLLPVYLIHVFPNFCFAVCASFCRIHFGFLYGLLLHITWNILPALSISF